MKPVVTSPKAVTSFTAILQSVESITPSHKKRLTTQDEIEKARVDAQDEGFARGYEDGFKLGLQKGRNEGHQQALQESLAQATVERTEQLRLFTEALGQVLGSIQQAVPEWQNRCEQEVTDLIMFAARQVLATELQLSRDSALGIVKEALREVTHASHARIRVNPFDSAILAQHRSELLASTASLRDLDLVDDPSIRGGCVIETDGGVIDATVDTRLRLIEGELGEAA